MASMLRIIHPVQDGVGIRPIAQFPPALVQELYLSRSTPLRKEYRFRETDGSLLAGRIMRMSVWNAHGQPPIEMAPLPGSTLFALGFPFRICGHSLIRYYSLDAGQRIWNYCELVAENYGIHIDQDCQLKGMDAVHPILTLVECRFPPKKKPTPMILTIPDSLSRQEYLVWIEQFMRKIYELLLDFSFKPLGPACSNLTFGFLEHNESEAGTFRAKAIVRPIAPHGQTFPDDFAVAEFTALPGPGMKMAVVIQATSRWMLNRHTNARQVLRELRDHMHEIRWGMESDEDSEDSELETHSESDSEPESKSEPEVNLSKFTFR
jgi:hypothetical protein